MLSFSVAAATFIEAQVSSLAVLLWEGLHGDAEVRAAGTCNSSSVLFFVRSLCLCISCRLFCQGEAFKQFILKVCISSPILSSISVNHFCLCEMSVVCPKHAFMPFWPGDSSSICSEGSELQCIFILELWFATWLIFSNSCDKEKDCVLYSRPGSRIVIGGIYLFVFIFGYLNHIICIRLVFQLHGFFC